MIVIAHLCLFAVMYAFGLPWLNTHFGAAVSFEGGAIAAALMSAASEAVVIAAALAGRAIALAFKINPLLQRGKASAISQAAVGLSLVVFLYAVSSVFPAVVSVSVLWALLIAGLTVAILELMVRVKGYWIAKVLALSLKRWLERSLLGC